MDFVFPEQFLIVIRYPLNGLLEGEDLLFLLCAIGFQLANPGIVGFLSSELLYNLLFNTFKFPF
jgi:hypothetical protein